MSYQQPPVYLDFFREERNPSGHELLKTAALARLGLWARSEHGTSLALQTPCRTQ